MASLCASMGCDLALTPGVLELGKSAVAVLNKTRFVVPMSPTFRPEPPAHALWFHEVKFDGYRIQIHKDVKDVALFSKNGNDFTQRYPMIAAAVAKLPTKAVVLDREPTLCDGQGNPDFNSLLMKRDGDLCVWVFDILSQFSKDLTHLRLLERRNKLDKLMQRVTSPALRQSKTFLNPYVLLKACAARDLEGIVSKRIDRPYVSGKSNDWIKVKCAGWCEKNGWRHEFFDRRR
jgi:bifunctional non-homologous end joining protein LigD